MANEKVWTPEQLAQANVPLWERFNGIPVDHAAAQVLQCELTAAREIIGDCVYSGDWDKLNAWLDRNTGGSDGR